VEDVLVVSSLAQSKAGAASDGRDEGKGGSGGSGEALSKIEIFFEVKFHKSTFIRWMIDSNTTTEMTKWLTAFQEHISKMSATHISNRDFKLASIKKVLLAPTKEEGDDGDSSDEEGSRSGGSGKGSSLMKVPKKITKSIKVAANQVRIPASLAWQKKHICVFMCLCIYVCLFGTT
jgi:hypothetical protein